jgi:hypothetical protein
MLQIYHSYMKKMLILLMLFTAQCAAELYTVAAAAIFQNEAKYLPEWIDYHQRIGVEHFWLYNNNSTDDYLTTLQPYIQSGLVELIDWPSYQEENDWFHFSFVVQTGAYNDAILRSKKLTRWLAVIDTDEFIVPLIDDDLLTCLTRFKREQGLYIHWLNFGTSNYTLGPNESMLTYLIHCALPDHPRNAFRKSIVNPKKVFTYSNPHLPEYRSGGHKEGPFVDQYLRINHYWTRDEWFFQNVKISRHLKWGGNPDSLLKLSEELNLDTNIDIQRHLIPKD